MIHRLINRLKPITGFRSFAIDFTTPIKNNVIPMAPTKVTGTNAKNLDSLENMAAIWKKHFKRCYGCERNGDWKPHDIITQKEALSEAHRCAKCIDSPCQKACPTNVPVREFVYSLQNKNYYGAAKTILSANPMGLTCGSMCPDSELCASACNNSNSFRGHIQIAKLQEHAMQVFKAMNIPQILPPEIDLAKLPATYKAPIALIGCGPASITCATFLARMGYQNIHVYEKENFPGGTISKEIPPNKAPLNDVKFEVKLMEDLGVKVFYGQGLGSEAIPNLAALRNKGYKAIFIGTGLAAPKMPMGNIYDNNTVFNSKTFLESICLKEKGLKEGVQVPDCKGKHVMILGLGNTAIDCAKAAFRLGAGRVTIAFRDGFSDLEANPEAFNEIMREGVNFIPYLAPKKIVEKDGKKCVEFAPRVPENNDLKSLKYKEKADEKVTHEFDILVTAFGSTLDGNWLKELDPKSQVNAETMQHKTNNDIFFGGDVLLKHGLISHAVNYGKLAAASMHLFLQGKPVKDPHQVKLPGFYTPIDLVDISTTVMGKKFDNPWGLSSAPPTTSYPMIRRAFQQGWSFAVIKTMCLDKDVPTNVSPRIFRGTADPIQNTASFSNIELITEKRCDYWIKKSKDLKKEFPNKILVGSLMCKHIKADWEELVQKANEGDFDFYELNLSCPHINDRGMGRAVGEDPDTAAEITKWCVNVAKRPIYVKLTPGIHNNKELAMKVMKAGAIGVTATNTTPSFQDPIGGQEPCPAVGKEKLTAFGGQAGEVNRPIALRISIEVANQAGFNGEIMASGGIVSAENAMAYLLFAGSRTQQVCSAVMNQDYTVINDLTSGLKALIYLRERKDLKEKGWIGMNPPEDFTREYQAPGQQLDISKLPKIDDLRGAAMKHCTVVSKMDVNSRMRPSIDNETCIKCGRCFTACLDSGYQAIEMCPKTHDIKITPRCTGCGLCTHVCPTHAMKMIPRKLPFKVDRGDN